MLVTCKKKEENVGKRGHCCGLDECIVLSEEVLIRGVLLCGREVSAEGTF